MNILFLTLGDINKLSSKGLYTDLLREFINSNHTVYVVSPVERRMKQSTHLIKEENAQILKIKTLNTQKTNILEKGISTVLLEPLFIHGIKKYFSNVKFDLVLYSTPPITLTGAVAFIKKRDHARTYLLLKDIFPQNAIDLGMLKTSGLVGIMYRHFRRQEKKLYALSDRIGCMSDANVRYLLDHNPEIKPDIVETCPNSIEIIDKSIGKDLKKQIRVKYGIPEDKTVFVYGGNFGKPQNVPFVIDCLKACRDLDKVYFIMVGNGTDYPLAESYVKASGQTNLKLMKFLPKGEYDLLAAACDVGLIFLDYRFTIPNFPSRLLGYLQARIPVLACTDKNTDVGKVIENGGFGRWCPSNSPESFKDTVIHICEDDLESAGLRGYQYLCDNYSVKQAAKTIERSVNN